MFHRLRLERQTDQEINGIINANNARKISLFVLQKTQQK